MDIGVDVLVLGGGVQGLTLMQTLAEEYSAVLVTTPLRDSESLHFHGYFSSGWNATNVEAAKVYRHTANAWRTYLEEQNVCSQQNPFYAVLTDSMVEALKPNWERAGIPFHELDFPKPFDLSRLPTKTTYHFPEDLVFDGAEVVRQIRTSFADVLVEGKTVGMEVDGQTVKQVSVRTEEQTLTFAPGFVLAACGGGNASLLQMLGRSTDQVSASQVARPLHMICARGKELPSISGFFLDLVVISHPLENGENLWLITYNPPEPQFTKGILEMSHDPEVEAPLVRLSLQKLSQFIPDWHEFAVRCRWDVYVGWKTEAPGDTPKALLELAYPKPYDVRDFGLNNFLAVWPNHWCLATPAAKEAANRVQTTLQARHVPGPLSTYKASHPDAGKMKWDRSDRQWQSWAEFTQRFGYVV